MTSKQYCQFWLTCASSKEAAEISRALLEKRLVACVKSVRVSSDYHWQGAIEEGNEVLLVMESMLDKFDEAEKLVASMHSYDTFVLQAIPMQRLSAKAQKWLEGEIA